MTPRWNCRHCATVNCTPYCRNCGACGACGSRGIHEMFCQVNWKEMGETYAKRKKEEVETAQRQSPGEDASMADHKRRISTSHGPDSENRQWGCACRLCEGEAS